MSKRGHDEFSRAYFDAYRVHWIIEAVSDYGNDDNYVVKNHNLLYVYRENVINCIWYNATGKNETDN